MTYLEGQILLLKARIDFKLASVTSRECLSRDMSKKKLIQDCTDRDKGDYNHPYIDQEGNSWINVPLTNQEKINRAMQEAKRLIEQLSETVEQLDVK